MVSYEPPPSFSPVLDRLAARHGGISTGQVVFQYGLPYAVLRVPQPPVGTVQTVTVRLYLDDCETPAERRGFPHY